MKKIPTQITPIFLWQRADHVDVENHSFGKVDVFEYEGEIIYLFDDGYICGEKDYDAFCHDRLIADNNVDEQLDRVYL